MLQERTMHNDSESPLQKHTTHDKSKAARLAAAKHSTSPVLATLEYAELSDQRESVTTDFERIKAEMLSELPPYRHPDNGAEAEYMIFFGPDCLKLDGRGYEQPVFVQALEKVDVPKTIMGAVKEYVRECELSKMELVQCKDELGELKAKFSEAKQIYDENRQGHSYKRNTKVVQFLELSTGHPTKRIYRNRLYFDYVTLVRKEGLSRKDAVEAIKKKYGISSCDRTIQILFNYRRTLFKMWDDIDQNKKQDRDYLPMLPRIKKRLRGLIPSTRTS
jgi:hypothetical protein